jgi:hypothetical protein
LSTTGFDDGFEAGARTMFGCSLDHWYRLEGAYFGAQSWSDAAAIYDRAINSQGGVGNLFSPFTNFGAAGAAVGLDYNNFTSIRFYSELHNAELNLRRRLLMRPGRYESSVIAGARYLNIEERFAYFAQSATPGPASSSNAVDVSADNEMIGVQLGLTGQFLVRPRYWIDCDVRGGVFHNDASQATLLTRTDNTGAVTPYSGAAQRDRSAFVGDLSLQMNCQFTRSLTLCAGYNAVWVTGVALGANNFNPDINVLTLGPATLDHKGVAVYHGPNIGLVLAR